MTSLVAFLADVVLGPRCPRCPHRARGWRTLADHLDACPAPALANQE